MAAIVVATSGVMGCRGRTSGTADGVVWRDAKGTVVEGLAPSFAIHVAGDPPLYLFDDRGLLWRVEPDDLTVSVASQYDSSRAWSEVGCLGTEIVYDPVPLPRVTFRAGGDPAIRVRPDGVARRTIEARSMDRGSGCIPAEGPVTGIAETVPAEPIEAPRLSYVAPLHPEPI